ncbi:MAG: adenylate kinase [Acidimicrobiia bacterium]|nr:MAG: adenylate kinase [Acidimicrobiia bacterium]
MRLLFIGPPGAGKGTQAKSVAERLGIAHISTGDMFRSLDPDTELGRKVNRIMQAGDYVPDEVVVEMLEGRLSQPDAARGFILDGFPRTLGQAEALDRLLGEGGLDRVVLLEVPEDELVRRMLARGRLDDTEAAIRNRLATYRRETEPLIDFYRKRSIVIEVDGLGEIEEVTGRVLEAIGVTERG